MSAQENGKRIIRARLTAGPFRGVTLTRVLAVFAGSAGVNPDGVPEWMTNPHGFLSSPAGGRVRHGFDLSAAVTIGPAEARLSCNIVHGYTGYLLAENECLDDRRT